MTILAARRYTGGKPQPGELTIDGVPIGDPPRGCFDWIGVFDPSPDEMARVGRQYGLHPLAIEDAMTPAQAAKVDVYDDQTFVIARTAEFDEADETLCYGQTALFVGAAFIVAVRFGSARAHTALRAKLEKDPEHLGQGPDYVAHAVLDFIVDGFEPIVSRIEDIVRDLEDLTVEAFPERDTIKRIFHLRRQLRRLSYVVGPMEEVCDKLATEHLPGIDASARVWFRDVYDHMRRAMAHFRGLGDTLASIVETGGMLEQHRQGEITRQLAAWAAILAVPTAIAGVYGMNFEHMPELHWRFGYPLAVAGMATICGTLWLRFRRIGWL